MVTQVTFAGPQQEPSIALNVLDNATLIVSTNDLSSGNNQTSIYRSTDGGASFSKIPTNLPSGFQASGDGYATYGYRNVFLVAANALNVNPVRDFSIVVYRSTDNGASFSNPIIVNEGYGVEVFNDKPSIQIDNSNGSPYLGRTYIAYTRFYNNFARSEILFQRSLDQGLTWSTPILLSEQVPGIAVFGTSVVVGPLGEVYVGWIQYSPGTPQFLMRRSDDGGKTFGPIRVVADIDLVSSPLQVPTFGFRVLTIAFLAVDISSFGAEGTLYAVWQDNRTGSPHIFLSRSTDKGDSWSAPIQVDDSPTNTANIFPAINVSRFNGAVRVTYYTNRLDSSLLDVYTAESNDAAFTFLPNRRLTTVSFDPNADPTLGTPTPSIGDYNDITINRLGASLAVWMSTRTGSQEIYLGS